MEAQNQSCVVAAKTQSVFDDVTDLASEIAMRVTDLNHRIRSSEADRSQNGFLTHRLQAKRYFDRARGAKRVSVKRFGGTDPGAFAVIGSKELMDCRALGLVIGFGAGSMSMDPIDVRSAIARSPRS